MSNPRKSPTERRLEGNPGKRPIPVEVFTPDGAPFVPEHLPEDAQACAEHILRSFRTKQLTAPDSYGLAAFAAAWAWHKAAVHEMSSPDFRPIVPGSAGNEIPNPWFKILDSQSRIMSMWAAKLYLTPADRASVDRAGANKSPSKFSGLLGSDRNGAMLDG